MSLSRRAYVISKLRYGTLPQIGLNTLSVLGIRAYPFYLYREGLACIPPGTPAPRNPGYTIGLAKREHLGIMLTKPDRNDRAEDLHNRLTRGDLCVAAWQGDNLVGWTWATFDELLWRGYQIPLGPDAAYLYDAYTDADSRGHGLAYILRRAQYHQLQDRGRTRLYSISDRFNPPAIRFKQKLGAVPLASGISLKLFGRWQYCTPSRSRRMTSRQPEAPRPQRACAQARIRSAAVTRRRHRLASRRLLENCFSDPASLGAYRSGLEGGQSHPRASPRFSTGSPRSARGQCQ